MTRTAPRCASFSSPDAVKNAQYLYGVKDLSLVAPESYTLDSASLARPDNDEIQLDLLLDYASNVALYPKFQEYFRSHRPPLLAVWGKNDPFRFRPGAKSYKRDNPDAEIHFLQYRTLCDRDALSRNRREDIGLPGA